MIRSMLFLPGNTPNMLINGDALGADAVILDLEDAVSPQEKDAARILVRKWADLCAQRCVSSDAKRVRRAAPIKIGQTENQPCNEDQGSREKGQYRDQFG